jgi:hypothetical protein
VKLSDLGPPEPARLDYALTDLVAEPGFAPKEHQTAAPLEAWETRKSEVLPSPDLERILAIPRREPVEPGSARSLALVEHISRRHRKPLDPAKPCDCVTRVPPLREGHEKPWPEWPCILRLREIQAWTLHEIRLYGGIDGSIGVGHGKCHAAGTEVFDYAAGRRRGVEEPGALRVATFDQTLRVGAATAFPSGTKACVRVELADGCAATPSADHPYLTHRGWVHAGDLTTGDFVAVAAEMPEPEHPTIAADGEVALIAYMLADGGCSQAQATFTNMAPAIIKEWQRLASTVCGGWSEATSRSRARQFRLLGARAFRARWDLYGLAKEKRAHAALWGLPRAQVALFLNRFWACDGHISAQGVEITLASEKLLDDVRFMLLRLGVRSRKGYTPKRLLGDLFPAWRLSLYGESAARFLEEVGDVLGKEAACQALRARLAGTKRNTNRDSVPIGRPELSVICDELGMPRRGGRRKGPTPRSDVRRFFSSTAGQNVSRARFVEFCRVYGYTGRYAHLATTDVAWERVKSVTPGGDLPVYDLSVPGTHNFVANGMIVHNTMLDLLAAMAMPGCRTAVLLVPASLVKQLIAEYEYLANHWRLPSMWVHGRDETDRQFTSPEPDPPKLHVMSYQRLSRAESTAWLHSIAPDLIIADESDKLSDLNTATVSRFMRYLLDHPRTRFVWWTGSPTDRSILEYQHLSRAALGELSPVPNDIDAAHDWARAIDPSDSPAPPGPLMQLCRPGEHIYEGFHRRLIETPGFIHTTVASSDVPLRIIERDPGPLPEEVAAALSTLRADWVRPDGWTYETALETAACARQLACGFYYYWHYPRGEPQSLIEEWLDTRKSWCGELRAALKTSRREHLDSELLLKRAAARYHGDLPPDPALPVWDSLYWPAWRDIADKVQPETRPILMDPFLAEDAAAWALENRGIVWYESKAFGRWIAEISGLELHSGGPEGEKRIAALVKKGSERSIIASMQSHGRGRNGLQSIFSTQNVAQPPSSPKMWEQMLGRLLRPGQTAPEVQAYLYRHTDELDRYCESALIRARYVRGTMGTAQKILDGGLRSRKSPKAE